MNTVTAHIDVSRPLGRNKLRIENPLPEDFESQEWVSHEDFWLGMEKKLNEHYGTNHKLKISK